MSFRDELIQSVAKNTGYYDQLMAAQTEQSESEYAPPERAKALLIDPDLNNFLTIMSNESAGILFKGLMNFFMNGELLESNDPIVTATFNMSKDKIIENNENYKKTCIRNHNNQVKRWENSSK